MKTVYDNSIVQVYNKTCICAINQLFLYQFLHNPTNENLHKY